MHRHAITIAFYPIKARQHSIKHYQQSLSARLHTILIAFYIMLMPQHSIQNYRDRM